MILNQGAPKALLNNTGEGASQGNTDWGEGAGGLQHAQGQPQLG